MSGPAAMILRNSGWNLLGQGLPLAAAIIAIPMLIGMLGTERFGVLTLLWVLVGYFSMFDLGIGRALTKIVAEWLATGAKRGSLAEIVGAGLALASVLGILGAVLLFGFAGPIGRTILTADSGVSKEVVAAIRAISPAIFLVIVAASLRGVLEAHQKFMLVNAVRSPIGALTYLAPVAVAAQWNSLSAITASLVALRGAEAILYAVACTRLVPGVARKIRLVSVRVRPLLVFGGWMTLTNIVGPFMTYLDRFLIAGAVSVTALAHYSTPYEVVTKLLAVPAAIVSAAFPAFSGALGADAGQARRLYARTLGFTFAAVLPVAGTAAAFAREGLDWWIDPTFAAGSAAVGKLLAVGVFINSLALVPFTLLQAAGRPDITAKLHLVELPCYLAALAWLVGAYGIVGAAIAWTGRVAVDAMALIMLSDRLLPGARAITTRVLALTVSAVALLAWAAIAESVLGRVVLVASLGALALVAVRILCADSIKR